MRTGAGGGRGRYTPALVAALVAVLVGVGAAVWPHPRHRGGRARSAHRGSTDHVVPASIPADCSRPVDADLSAFIASVPDGSSITFPPNACYAQDRSIVISDRNDLAINANGSTLKAVTEGDPCRANVRIRAGRNIRISGLTVRGIYTTGFDGPRPPAPASQCQHGFSFESTQGGQLVDSKAFDVIGDPVSIEPDQRKGDYCAVPPARDILVDRFYGANAGRTVGITDGDGITIQNSYFGDLFDNGVDLEADVACEWMRNIKLLNNHFGRYHYAMVNVWTDVVEAGHTGTLEIRGNVVDADPVGCYAAVNVGPGNRPNSVWVPQVTIADNDLRTLGQGIYVNNVADAAITHNTLRKNYGAGCASPAFPDAYGVWLDYSRTVSVRDNVLVGGPAGGFAAEVHVGTGNTGVT